MSRCSLSPPLPVPHLLATALLTLSAFAFGQPVPKDLDSVLNLNSVPVSQRRPRIGEKRVFVGQKGEVYTAVFWGKDEVDQDLWVRISHVLEDNPSSRVARRTRNPRWWSAMQAPAPSPSSSIGELRKQAWVAELIAFKLLGARTLPDSIVDNLRKSCRFTLSDIPLSKLDTQLKVPHKLDPHEARKQMESFFKQRKLAGDEITISEVDKQIIDISGVVKTLFADIPFAGRMTFFSDRVEASASIKVFQDTAKKFLEQNANRVLNPPDPPQPPSR